MKIPIIRVVHSLWKWVSRPWWVAKRYLRFMMTQKQRFGYLTAIAVLALVCFIFYLFNNHPRPFNLQELASMEVVHLQVDDSVVDWNSINVREKPPSNTLHDKWIVVTTINLPTNDIKKLASIPGWKVVIVGDKKSPKKWSYPNCIHLFVEDQLKLNYKVTSLIKYHSYARKNIGYLYAIERGAKIIYETDDDNSPTVNEIGFDKQSKLEYYIYQPRDSHVMNPYAHFGQRTIWPRGYPLDKVSLSNTYSYQQCKGKKALVQQGVVNGDPDVDAIFRLTRKSSDKAIDVYFDPKAQPIMLPKGVMAPYNSQNTLHLYESFWGLLLPQTVAFRVTDIWRGYWTQRLLWELDGYLTFFPPNAYTKRNSHSYLSDFIDERELYHLSSKLTTFLVKWKSNKAHFFDRILDLASAMAKAGFWKENDVTLIKFWLMDLVSIGYKVPSMKTSNTTCGSKIQIIKPKEQKSSYLKTDA